MKIGIVGAGGRMGRMNVAEVAKTQGMVLAGALEIVESPFIGKDANLLAGIEGAEIVEIESGAESFVKKCDAIIDFSSPESTLKLSKICAKNNVAHIIGTTGLTPEQEDELKQAAKDTAIIYAPNMSIGVNLLFQIVEKVSSILDEDYDIEVVEMHHNKKVDSPSGTALGLGKAAARGRKVELSDVWCKARDGVVGARKKGEIGFATLRGGDVVGDHTVMFATEGERVEITHKASSRSVFSKGAVRACLWSKGKNAGFYSMMDVLGF